MAGLVPAIYAAPAAVQMAGTSPAMTVRRRATRLFRPEPLPGRVGPDAAPVIEKCLVDVSRKHMLTCRERNRGARRRLPRPENRTAHTHPGGTAGDRHFEIRRHAHGDHRQPVPRRAIRQPGEMRAAGPGRAAARTSARPAPRRSGPCTSSMKPSASSRDTPDFCASPPTFTSISSVGVRPSLAMAAAIASARRGRSSVSITSASCTASRALLVCNPPMMCRFRRNSLRSAGKLRRRLLHAILAEHGLPGLQRRAHRFQRLGLGHRDQRDFLRLAAGADRGFGDPVAHALQVGGDVGSHCCAHAVAPVAA